MSSPTVAVVIPAYNRPDDLLRALQSVAAQSRPANEVVVCDDGSKEDLSAVIAAFESRLPLRCVRIPNSGGPARPRNVAVEHTSSDWIALLDADDWWEPSKLAAVYPALERSEVVYHKLRSVCDERGYGVHRRVIGWNTLSARAALYDLLTIGNPIPASSALVRRELYGRVGGMQHSPATVEDFDFWAKVALHGARFEFVDRILGHYQITPNSRSSTFLSHAGYFQEMFARYEPHFDPAQIKAVVAFKHYLVGIQYMHGSEWVQARAHLERAADLRLARQRISRLAKLLRVSLRMMRAGAPR
ncbi:glycosyltransferase family 2 protein [Steroidobacter sp. S1-65]|uniref:Glycosyltransferase family 2 protein n=1 Tax=Steroidobacter gossypii TaxID=2805490 RepID=A0ABS1WYW0_9GAMM|nr:glycosyltransferase family 2 protein [Steroidobacter gossypii]MBM0106162.1 glycosyltransferase family 2 protein [Steroidobacter gossypii]